MRVLLLKQCLKCRKIYGYEWTNIKIVDIVIDGKFGITISHGYCDDCFKEWQGGEYNELYSLPQGC